MKNIGKFFREKRAGKGMSLREAAKASEMSHVHVKEIEEGKKSPSFDKVMNLLRAYMVDADEFLRETGYLAPNVEPAGSEKLYKVPLVSWSVAEKQEKSPYAFSSDDTEKWITSDVGGASVFALRINDDSMEPEFHEGDTIVVDPRTVPGENDFVIVKNAHGEFTFKQLKKYGKTRLLHPLNPKYPDIELSDKHQYRIIGKVVKKEKRY